MIRPELNDLFEKSNFMKNILVTGGAGFIGSHTVVALAEAGFRPVIVDDFSNSHRSVLDGIAAIIGQDVGCYNFDCNEIERLREVIRDEKIDGVIHFAASKAVGESMKEPLRYYRNNVGGMITLLEAMEAEQVRYLIFSSSCTVYGEPENPCVTEEMPVQPASSVYGNTKQICEEIMHDYAAVNPLKSISLRYFNPIGAHPSAKIGELPLGVPSNLVPYLLQVAAGIKESLTVFGDDYPTPDGTCIRDYIHVMDLAEAHVAALNFLIKSGESNYYDVINIGTGTGSSVMELIRTFETISETPLNYQIGPRRPGDITAIWSDVQKANSLLGWKARRSMRDALEDAWRWQQTLVETP